MPDRRPKKALRYFIITLILMGIGAYYDGNFKKFLPDSTNVESVLPYQNDNPQANVNGFDISDRARQHILYGDHRGGGHKYGLNKPCKSEFPQDWDDREIIETVSKIAANDNAHWKEQDNGYYVTESMQDGIKVRVVMNGNKSDVITAYPTNVKRNHCPSNDNRR